MHWLILSKTDPFVRKKTHDCMAMSTTAYVVFCFLIGKCIILRYNDRINEAFHENIPKLLDMLSAFIVYWCNYLECVLFWAKKLGHISKFFWGYPEIWSSQFSESLIFDSMWFEFDADLIRFSYIWLVRPVWGYIVLITPNGTERSNRTVLHSTARFDMRSNRVKFDRIWSPIWPPPSPLFRILRGAGFIPTF